MGRAPCCNKVEMHKGPWAAKEDALLTNYIQSYGEGNWRNLPKKAGLLRCGKSCRLRWMNYLRPDIKLGNIRPEEEDLIVRLHALLGNRWSLIAGRIPGRTDNEIKNYWNTHLSKKLKKLGVNIREGISGSAPRRNHASQKSSTDNNSNGSNSNDNQDKRKKKRKKKKNTNEIEDPGETTRTEILCPKPTRLASILTRSNAIEGSSNSNHGSTTSEEEKGDTSMENLGGGAMLELEEGDDPNPNYDIAFELPSFNQFPLGDDLLFDRIYQDYWQLPNSEDDQVQMDFFAEPLFAL